MLILDRKRDQKIMIGDEIVLTVVEIRYGSVRIGIEADPSIPIHREEVAEKIVKGRGDRIE
jgi:carbon storage regulator